MNATATQTDRFEAMRHAMVASQLRTNAVSEARVGAAMTVGPREKFAPDEAAELAYRDTAVPLAHGRAQNLPIATGKLLTAAELRPDDRVLLIGAAVGYSAAVRAEQNTKKKANKNNPTQASAARAALAPYPTVTLVEGALD